MEEKDYPAISQSYSKLQHTEFIICHLLNGKMPEQLKKIGYFFELQTGNQYGHNDLVLVKICPDRTKRLIMKVEFEYGEKQIEWDNDIPKHWDGLNLLVRKSYGQNFSLFIKSSPTFNSIFAVDCTDDFIVKNFEISKLKKHNLGFKTNKLIYKIPMNELDKYKYVEDKYRYDVDYKNKRVVIVKNDPMWKDFYSFLYRRFLDKIETKIINNN